MVPFLDTTIVRFDSKILWTESTLSNSALVLLYFDEGMIDPFVLKSAYSILLPPVPMYFLELQINEVPCTVQFTVKVSPIHLTM